MKINYFIDQVRINVLEKYTHVCINGWAVSDKGEIPSFIVKVNNLEEKMEIITIPRRDVCKKYKLEKSSLQCGFRITLNSFEEISKLELIANVNNITTSVLSLNKKGIDKISNNDSVEYSIDSVSYNKESGLITVSGWATSYYNENIVYTIEDSAGNAIETMIRSTNREDLYRLKIVDINNKYCGFMMNFSAQESKKYYLLIETQTFSRKIDLNSINKTSITAIGKEYIKALNVNNITKGMKYLKENGPKKFLKRLKQGPGIPELRYSEWFDNNKVSDLELRRQCNHKFDYKPMISIIVPTYNTPIEFLKDMIESVKNQSYSNWQLCIADGSDENNPARKIIEEYSKNDSRIEVCYLEENYGISGNTNKALELAKGEYVGLFDHDDLLTPDALYEVVLSLQKQKYDIIYTDEDKLNNKTKTFVDPNFKPDFSIDLFRSHNYITHFFVVATNIIKGIGGFRSEFDGSQDYDLMFRCIEQAKNGIYHIPKVLYHWRMHEASTAENPESKLYCYEAGKKAIEEHYKRVGIDAKVEMMPKPLWGMYKTTYSTYDNPLVSIIIPNMEHKNILKTCIDSLLNVNTYKNFEIIIIENNSKSKEIFDYYNQLENENSNIKVVKWDKEFNYSAINNYGVTFAKGEYILFLNNDTEIIEPTAISEMLGCCMRDEVGIVGAKLLYEDDTVQHAGVVIGFGGFAGHVFNGIKKDDYGYMVRARINCNYSAVTAACMMVKKEYFDKVNGFDSRFKVACNDIDFCLRVRELNKLVVYNAFSLWYHYESKSRGYEDNIEKIKRFESEVALFQERWGKILKVGDPYYNSNFKIEHGPFVL